MMIVAKTIFLQLKNDARSINDTIMKKIKIFVLLALSVSCMNVSSAQNVFSKDGLDLGNREELISDCMEGIGTEKVTVANITVSSQKLCSCMVDVLMPNMTGMELASMAEASESEILTFLTDYQEVLVLCMKDELGDFQFSEDFIGDNEREMAINSCVEAFQESSGGMYTDAQARSYCTCAIDKMLSLKLSFGDVMNLDQEDGKAYNEVVMACLNDLLGEMGASSNVYNPSDIRGGGTYTKVTLINNMSINKKIKLNIGGVDRYFLFDTGASDLLITRELEQILVDRGAITEDSYLGTEQYELADGREVQARMVVLNNVKVGDYYVDNVVAAVLDEGGGLCGLGFLNKFKNWEIKDNNYLLLYK